MTSPEKPGPVTVYVDTCPVTLPTGPPQPVTVKHCTPDGPTWADPGGPDFLTPRTSCPE